MIDALIRAALNNRLLVLVLVAILLGGGYYSYKQVPIDSFPDVTPTMVQIYTSSPGLSPKDVEALISYPIEISMYGLPHLDRVQSTSIFGLSRVNVYFSDEIGTVKARRLVMERLNTAEKKIPSGLGDPKMGPMVSGLGRVLMYTLVETGDKDFSLKDKRTVQDWIVKPMLRTVPNVTGVLSLGGYQKQYQVRLDQNAMLARDLTVSDVRKALSENNLNVGASYIESGGQENIIRGYGWIDPGKKGLKDISNIVVANHNGTPVLMRDIAEVTLGRAIRRGAQVANGSESVGGYVLKLIGTNTQQVLHDVEAKIGNVQKALPDGLKLKTFYSQTTLINKAVGTVQEALLYGSLLVLVFLYLFLGNIRSTLIVLASLPLSALIAFMAMHAFGISANLMSLGGLAIGIGMMVDGSIVMIDNIFRHLQMRQDDNIAMTRLVSEAAREVARPITFAVGIIIIVFLPLFTLQGVEGKMFSPMAYTISFALAGALLMALVFVPVISSYVFQREGNYTEPRIVPWLRGIYRPLVTRAYNYPRRIAAMVAIIFVGSLALFPLLGAEFVPTLREGTFYVRSTLPPGANLSKSVEYAKRFQKVVKHFPEVTGTYSRVGRAEVGGDPEPVNVVATTVTLRPLTEWTTGRSYEELQSAMAERIEAKIPGLANNFSQPIQLRTDELLSGIKAEVSVSIYGDDLDKLADIGQRVKHITHNVEGAVDVRMQQQGGKPQVVVKPDRSALARYGLSDEDVLKTVELGVGGSVVGKVFDGIRRFDIFMRLDKNLRDEVNKLRKLKLRTPDGAVIPLSRVADVKQHKGPKKISRSKASRRVFVQFNVRNRDMGSVVTELQKTVDAKIDMPPGYFVEYGGQFENQRRAMQRLYIVVPITLGLIFLMLFSTFNSLRYAALIYLNVPIAISGGLFALYISGMYLSVPAAVGFIAVFGVAVQNGVVLVSYINQLRERGTDMQESVLTGAEHRLRPVLMTAFTAILGLIPLLVAEGVGANVQRPLAAVVTGGVVTSTLLTLFVLPGLYRWFAGNGQNLKTV